MPLSPDQIKTIEQEANMIENNSDITYAEIRIIYKKPYWRHMQVVNGVCLPVPKEAEKERRR